MIASVNTTCPSPTQLEAALVGGPAAVVVARHAERCDTCRRALAEMRENLAFLDELHAATTPEPEDPGPADVMEDHVGEGPRGYRLDHVIRRGGQGVVYRATHLASGRAVAVKVLLDGRLSSDRARRRFEREIEIIAGLDDAGIVTLHDSGVTPDGCPYLVMEHLDGRPLDRWLAEADGDLDRRLRLFTRLAESVDAAHRKGVIHRDLKPANVIVDDDDHPHVIDFGIAAAPDGRRGSLRSGRLTVTGEFMGTLAYVAPEQVCGDWRAVDTSTDVYALGVMLYEAVAGQTPHADADDLDTFVRSILDDAFPAPPTSADPRRPVSRDLQTIVLTCLAREPRRRYPNAGALAADLHRLASDEPIDARRDDRWYVVRKMLARHRAATVVAVGFILLLASFAVTTGALYQQTAAEATRLRQVNLFLEDTIGSVAGAPDDHADPTVHDLLADAEHWVDLALGDDPEAATSILVTLANGYRALGDRGAARRLLDDAAQRTTTLGDEQRARVLGARALLARDEGDFAAAATHLESALALRRDALGPTHPAVAMTLAELGRLDLSRGDLETARRRLTRSFDLRQRRFGVNHPEVAMAHFHLGDLAEAEGDLDAARRHHALGLEIRRARLHPAHPDIARSEAALRSIGE